MISFLHCKRAVKYDLPGKRTSTHKLHIFGNQTVLQNQISNYMVPELRFLKSFSVKKKSNVHTYFWQVALSPNETVGGSTILKLSVWLMLHSMEEEGWG